MAWRWGPLLYKTRRRLYKTRRRVKGSKENVGFRK